VPGPLLREFVYVDVQKVRGLLAQLDEGIVEAEVSNSSDKKTTFGGVKGVASHQVEWGSGAQSTKAMGDALFPALEGQLEAHAALSDISYELTEAARWHSQDLREEHPAGSLVGRN